MINGQKVRAWATPLTVGAFALSAITGVMLFFHVNIGLVKPAHEWFSWFLVLGGLLHIVGSWRPFVGHLNKPVAKAIMAAFVLLIAVSLLPLGKAEKGMPPGKMSAILLRSPLSTVAAVAGHAPEDVIKQLALKGVRVETGEQTIKEIAARNHARGVDILSLIF